MTYSGNVKFTHHHACPLCFSKRVKIISQRKKLIHLICSDCHFAYTVFSNMHDQDKCKMQYGNSTISNEYFTRGMFVFNEERKKLAGLKANLRYEYYSKLVGKPIKSLLEIGCADGIFYQPYNKLGVHWRGIEISKEAVESAMGKNIPVEFLDFSELKNDVKYDVCFASQVLEHFIDPNIFMKKCYEVLNEGGILHLDVPNHDGVIGLLSRKLNPFVDSYGGLQPPYHLCAYNKQALTFLMNKHGFEIKQVAPYTNDDDLFGQIGLNFNSLKNKLLYRFSGLLNRGSLLVGVGQKKYT